MENQSLATFEFEKPLVYVTFTGNEFNDKNFEKYTLQSHKAFEWDRYGMIYDVSKVEYVQAKYRILQGKDVKENKDKIENQAIGLALIAPSFLQRTLIQAVFLIISYPSKVQIFKDKKEAMKWINELLEEEEINTKK